MGNVEWHALYSHYNSCAPIRAGVISQVFPIIRKWGDQTKYPPQKGLKKGNNSQIEKH